MPSEDNKRIAKNTVYLYLRTSITIIVSIYTSRVVFRALGIEDFGIWGVLGGIITMFNFINQSLSSSIFRYVTYAIGAEDEEQINKVYSCSIIIHIGLALLIFILCETIGQWLFIEKLNIPESKYETSKIVFNIAILTSSISLLSVPFNSVIIAYERMHIFAYLSIVDTILKLAIAGVVYLVTSNKLVWYSVMMLSVTILMLLFYYVYVHVSFRNLKFRWIMEKRLFKSLLTFSGWNMFGNIAAVGYNQGLTILLNIFFGPTVNAARSISLQIEQTIRTFVTNFQSAINPQIVKTFAQKEMSQMHTLMYRSSKFSLFLLYIFALPIVIETDKILYIWLGQVQPETVKFIRIMFCVIALETISNSIMTGVMASGIIKRYQITVSSILIAIVPVSYIVLKAGAPAESVFIVYLAIEIIAVIARLYIARDILKFSLRKFTKYVIAHSITVIILGALPPFLLHITMPDGYIRFTIVILCGGITSIASIYLFGLSQSERLIINKTIRNKLSR